MFDIRIIIFLGYCKILKSFKRQHNKTDFCDSRNCSWYVLNWAPIDIIITYRNACWLNIFLALSICITSIRNVISLTWFQRLTTKRIFVSFPELNTYHFLICWRFSLIETVWWVRDNKENLYWKVYDTEWKSREKYFRKSTQKMYVTIQEKVHHL